MISCYLLWTDVLIDPDVGSEDTEMLGEGWPAATEKEDTWHSQDHENVPWCWRWSLSSEKAHFTVDMAVDRCVDCHYFSLLMMLIRTMCIFLILHFQYIYNPWYPDQVINYSLRSWILLHKSFSCLGTKPQTVWGQPVCCTNRLLYIVFWGPLSWWPLSVPLS